MRRKNRHMSKKMDILDIYLSDYLLTFSGREISRRLQVSPQAALNALQELADEGVLAFQQEGRNKMYHLLLKDLRTRLFLAMAETSRSRDFLNNFELRSVVETVLPWAHAVIVFGSFAQGKQKENSDLDLVVIGVRDKEAVKKSLLVFPREVNAEFVSWEEFSGTVRKKNALAVEIKKNHLVYGNVFKVVEVYCTL